MSNRSATNGLLCAVVCTLSAPVGPARLVSPGPFSPVGLIAQESGPSLRAVATRVPSPPRVDGVLDEPFWSMIDPITGFRQRDPVDGAAPSERTEVRIAYDENGIYFGMTMFDSEPDKILRNILQRG